jgi:hypothetical protein
MEAGCAAIGRSTEVRYNMQRRAEVAAGGYVEALRGALSHDLI